MRVAVLCSRIRVEEKLLLRELERRGVAFERLDDARLAMRLDARQRPCDLLLDRSLSFGRSLYALMVLEARGVRCVNRATVVATCGDKLRTNVALQAADLPTPKTSVAFTKEAALEALTEIGYPAVIKPVVGSWGRLIARVNDPDAAEAVLEDRETLGSWQQKVFYLQELIDKPGRDIRAFVTGGETIAAIHRRSEHWITNTGRGGSAELCPLSPELTDLVSAAARAVGGGLLAVDLVETRAGELRVLEVNHSMEFRNSIEPTGVDIPARMIDYFLAEAAGDVPRSTLEGTA